MPEPFLDGRILLLTYKAKSVEKRISLPLKNVHFVVSGKIERSAWVVYENDV